MPRFKNPLRRYLSAKHRKKAWAKRARKRLIEAMGGKCVNCGTRRKLEFNHLEGRRTWRAAEKGRETRVATYAREWAEGKLDLRCSKCNKKYQPPAETREPF